MSDWRDCIISYVDLVGIKNMASVESTAATAAMLQFHDFTKTQIASMPSHDHVYTWNDSAAFVSYPRTGTTDHKAIVRELCDFIRAADRICRSYAIMVKGKAFPQPASTPKRTDKYTFMTISSWAFANCFKVEKELGKHHKRLYVDGRIIRACGRAKGDQVENITMYPNYYRRDIHMYKDVF